MRIVALLIVATGLSGPVFATNGMKLAGYGPIAEAMGGASAAYDNGNAAMINNPATLGYMASGTSRLDVALGDLMPRATANGQESTAKSFFMPGLGYVRKDGELSWGVGVMAQGGMGTEYSNGAFWGTFAQGVGLGVLGGSLTPAAYKASIQTSGAALKNMSEVGVGRVIFPLAYQVNEKFNIGGSIDYVWAGMDTKWVLDGAHFLDMTPSGTQHFGSMTGNAVTVLGAMVQGGAIRDVGWGYFDFEKAGKFGQQATGSGWAGNIGFTYDFSPRFAIGGVYHAKTHLSDLTTAANGANVSFNVNSTGLAPTLATPGAQTITINGKATIKNFQWPENYSLGISYRPNEQWQIVADYKRINWSGVMQALNMKFEGFMGATDMGFDLSYKQQWNDQDVLQLGAACKYSDALTLRFGTNIANNPIPDAYVSPMFPAIIKTHYMGGFGYAFSNMASFDAAYVYTPKVSVTNNWSAIGAAAGVTNQNVSLGGSSWTMMYTHRF